jgi:electron transport complex protein RnfG
MSESPGKTSYIGQAWLVIVLAFCFGGALAFVQTTLGPKIAENKRNETYRVIPALVPGAEPESTEELVVQGADGRDVRVYKAFTADGSHLGWVIPARGQGFADVIELLIGQDASLETITGLYVLAQKETPGLGDFIRGEDFQSRFTGRPAAPPLVVVKTDPREENEIRALTGATISSESVTTIVNAAIANLRDVLATHRGTNAPE